MDALDRRRSVSDHNSNAQVEPTRNSAVGMGEAFQGELDRSTGSLSEANGAAVEIGDIKTQDSTVLYDYQPYNINNSDEDTSDNISESGNSADGRRSCCSLSDETSSMSDTELSVQGDDGNTPLTNYTASDMTSESQCQECIERTNTVTSKDRQACSEPPNGEHNDSVADDTFTDLTMDSLNLSLMENCIAEEECSILPEISTLEITASDFSFDWGEPGIPDSQGKPVDTKTGKVDTADKKDMSTYQQQQSADGKKSVNDKNENEHKIIETCGDESKTRANETDKNKPAENCPPTAVEGSNTRENQTTEGQLPEIEGLHNFYNIPLQQSVMFYPPNPNQIPQPFPFPLPQTMGNGPHAYQCMQNQNFQQQHQQEQHMMYQQQQMRQTGQPWVPPQPVYRQCCHQYGVPATNFEQCWPNQTPGYDNTAGQVAMPFNTSGLLTAEQFYAGQETPDQSWPVPQPFFECASQVEFEAQPEASNQDMQNFQYPCVYVSQAGLITVLLKHDVSVEFTVDKTLRLVSHQRKLVAATNCRGSANYLYHPYAKVYHEGTTTEVELSEDRKVRMSTEDILIAKGDKCYRFDYKDVHDATPDFRDISKDNSVSLLFGSSGYGPELVPRCLEVAQNAQYTHNNDGSFRVRINDISIFQSNRGDVTVLCGPKFLKIAPLSCYLRVQTHFIDMAVYQNSKIFVRRGTHSLDSNPTSLRVNNGNLEAAFEDGEDLSICQLPRRTPLNGISQRQKKKPHGSSQRKSKYTWRSQ